MPRYDVDFVRLLTKDIYTSDDNTRTMPRAGSGGGAASGGGLSRQDSDDTNLTLNIGNVPEYTLQRSVVGMMTPFSDIGSPDVNGFIPPWAEWDFNEWENCTDNEQMMMVSLECCSRLSVTPAN